MNPKMCFDLSPFDCVCMSGFIIFAYTHPAISLDLTESHVDSEGVQK